MKRIVIKKGHSHIIYKRQLRWLWIWWTLERHWYYATSGKLKDKIERAKRAGYAIIDRREKSGVVL